MMKNYSQLVRDLGLTRVEINILVILAKHPNWKMKTETEEALSQNARMVALALRDEGRTMSPWSDTDNLALHLKKVIK